MIAVRTPGRVSGEPPGDTAQAGADLVVGQLFGDVTDDVHAPPGGTSPSNSAGAVRRGRLGGCTSHDEETEVQETVLVIGAGPSGLFVTAELARHGVSARLVERDPVPHHEARAASIRPGTLEILESVGLARPLLDAAVAIRNVQLCGPDLVQFGQSNYLGIDCAYDILASIPQYETERLITQRLRELGGRVERGVTATDVSAADDDDVVVDLRHPDGRVETVQPSVVIGAGGAHSVTRESMHEQLEGSTYGGRFVVADLRIDAPVFPPDEAAFVFGRSGMMLLAPMPNGRWLTAHDLADDDTEITARGVVNRTESMLGGRSRAFDVTWVSTYRAHRRIGTRLNDGRRSLNGDAIHLSSPFAGQGLNAGLQDGFDLAWKLALVLRSDAPRTLLDDYAIERRIADEHVLEVSDRTHRSIMVMADTIRRGDDIAPVSADPIEVALARDAGAMIDIDYRGSPLVLDCDPADSTAPRPGQRYPDWNRFAGTNHHLLVFGDDIDLSALTVAERRWSKLVRIVREPDVDPRRAGVPEGGIVLVRPDGHIGFRSTVSDAAAVGTLERHLETYLHPSD